MKNTKPIFVTQPSLPPFDEFIESLKSIWDSRILTNCGPNHQELEAALCRYLGVGHISLFSNGTIALITALQALGVTGEVITTPYSFVATSNSLLWNNIKPVFVDIDAETLNIDPRKIEAAITSSTTAIMPVHCYGRPCDVDSIKCIADKYGLRVIYDAAHAFGVSNSQGSILNHGDLSVLSFHATKVFNTFEGGAIVSANADMKRRIDQLKNFGFVDEITVTESGINGKMSEINAAFGLVQLKYIDQSIGLRRDVDTSYRKHLHNVKGISLISEFSNARSNYSYFPILVESDYHLSRDELYLLLKENNIYSRRYFYPLISEFPMYRSMPSALRENLPVAAMAAEKILCLPIYSDLSGDDVTRVVEVIANSLSSV